MPALLDIAEVAAALGLSEKTVRRRIKAKAIRAANLGSADQPMWRVAPEALAEYVRGRTNRPEPKAKKRLAVTRFF